MSLWIRKVDAELYDGTVESMNRIQRMLNACVPGFRTLMQMDGLPDEFTLLIYRPNGGVWVSTTPGRYIVCAREDKEGTNRLWPYLRDKDSFEAAWERHENQ